MTLIPLLVLKDHSLLFISEAQDFKALNTTVSKDHPPIYSEKMIPEREGLGLTEVYTKSLFRVTKMFWK